MSLVEFVVVLEAPELSNEKLQEETIRLLEKVRNIHGDRSAKLIPTTDIEPNSKGGGVEINLIKIEIPENLVESLLKLFKKEPFEITVKQGLNEVSFKGDSRDIERLGQTANEQSESLN